MHTVVGLSLDGQSEWSCKEVDNGFLTNLSMFFFVSYPYVSVGWLLSSLTNDFYNSMTSFLELSLSVKFSQADYP